MKQVRGLMAAALVATLGGCATLQQLAALRQVAFGLGAVQNGSLAGVPLAKVAAYRDLSAVDIGRLALAVARKDLPLQFTANVRADNPADNHTTATMVRLAWSLLLDEKETINGVLDSAVTIPAGQVVNIPLQMRLNLMQFFDGPAESLLNLAAGLAGFNADPTRIKLRAVPTVNTPLGPISYPEPITIVNRTVGGGGGTP